MSNQSSTTKGLVPRPPVVAVMGHVDHGKSSLLDYIRKTNVVATEAGGITQHLSAYAITHRTPDGATRAITFIDTPGHAAFSGMRHRGAAVADIAILIISSEEGVKAQTIEAIKTIRSHHVPFVVAISKMDRPQANPEKIKNELLEAGVFVEGYGGDVPVVTISCKTGAGVDDLIETILLLADMQEFKGDPAKPGEGFVIEAHLDEKRGITATLIIKDGTVRQGDFIVAGESFAGTRIMEDFAGRAIQEATFSSPLRIIGFSTMPTVGALFTVECTKRAAEDCARANKQQHAKAPERVIGEDEMVTVVPIIIKADAYGTAEAIEGEIRKLSTDDVWMKVIKKGIGTVNEDDIKTALSDPNTIIVGFNVAVDRTARDIDGADRVNVQTFSIIYKLTEWLESVRAERRPKKIVDEVHGALRVLKYFSETKGKHLIGGRVDHGTIDKRIPFRIVRNGAEIARGAVESLQQARAEVSRCESGTECGMVVDSKVAPEAGDTLEFFEKKEV